MKTVTSILPVILLCSSICICSSSTTRHNRELETALLDLFETNVHQQATDHHQATDNGRILAQKREEKRILKELYYLAKVLQAFRLPHAYGSNVFKSAVARVTNRELLEQLERKLRKENGFEVISRIGTNGTAPDPLQFQLANDYRLLAPVLVRTLRRVLSLKKVPETLQVNEKNNFLYELQWDVQNEWLNLREAAKHLQGDGVTLVKPLELYPNKGQLVPEGYGAPIEVAPEVVNVEETDTGADWVVNPIASGYQWGDARESAARPEDLENLAWEIEERRNTNRQPEPQTPVVIIQQSTTKISEAPAPVKPLPSKVRPFPVLVSPPVSSVATQLTAEVDRITRELIAVELDKFLLRVEDLSGVDGFSKEFDRSDRARMIGWVKQFYSPTVGLDQREFVRALRRLLKTKQLRRGRPDVLEALDYLQSQLDIDQRDGLNDEIFADDVVGGPCGCHGSYTFYKGLKITFGTKATHELGSGSTSSASSVVSLPASAPGSGSVAGGPSHSTANTTSIDSSSTTSNGHDRRRPSVDIPSEGGTNTADSPDSSSTAAQPRTSSVDGVGIGRGGSAPLLVSGGFRLLICAFVHTPLLIHFCMQHYRPLVLALGDCIPVRPWSDSPIACLAELRMVWKDRNEQCLLIALRLYFLPENTPLGRNCHGETNTFFYDYDYDFYPPTFFLKID
uniref:Uncharacterized protein n=1 Tax=Anopheles culicifacies TaxID=139723 RepID=A0A182MGY3_9DIPT